MTTARGRDGREWKVDDDLVGRGGVGFVYRAVGESSPTVIKLIPKAAGADRELLFPDDMDDIRHVIPVLDVVATDDRWGLVMPEAEMSLRDRLNAEFGPLSVEETVSILIDLAETLVDLEAKGIVNRDVKPENLLLWQGHWCMTDFGIARYAAAATAPDTHKYSKTYEYAAPEQWRGERATNATDVYAFGIVGIELATGTRPFAGPHEADFRDQHLHGDLPPLDQLPRPLATLLQQCAMKVAGNRPRPEEVLTRLQRLAVDEPTSDARSALQRAYRAAVEREAQQSLDESRAQSEGERRASLLRDAVSQLTSIRAAVRTAIDIDAPGLVGSSVVSRQKRELGGVGWSLPLGGATLTFGPAHEDQPGYLPFDVVAHCEIAISQPADRSKYEGRSHSLWFADALEAGTYRWYELAFMDHPLVNRPISRVDPFADAPSGNAAAAAFRQGNDVFQLAWPVLVVDPGDLDEFVQRWISWWSQAAGGGLSRPQRMPERDVPQNWRK